MPLAAASSASSSNPLSSRAQLPAVIALMGPTASGKSALAFKLAEKLGAELVSLDAVTIYKGFNIGSAKPTQAQQQAVVHHMLNRAEPWEVYTMHRFVSEASILIQERLRTGVPLILVGGTFLYFKGLIEGFSPLPEACPELREQLLKTKNAIGLEGLYQKLQQCDPDRARSIHPHDTHRIIRALEIFQLTQTPMSALLNQRAAQFSLKNYPNFHSFALLPPSLEHLKLRIRERFSQMIAEGFLDEVASLFQNKRLTLAHPSVRSLGYRQIWDYFLGLCSSEEAYERAMLATGAFAKRQLTWLRSWPYSLERLPMDAKTKAYETILQRVKPEAI